MFGHNARDCRSKVYCVVCSSYHAVKDCPIMSERSVICINCGSNHAVSYGGCSCMKNARDVEKVCVECNLSYREGVLKVKRDPQSLRAVSQSALTNPYSIPVSRLISPVKAASSIYQ